MSKRIKIFASFDDGDQLDLTLADMLIKYKIPAVFYIPVKARDLSDHQVRQLAGTLPNCEMCKITKDLFEIGAHSVTHPREFNELTDKELEYEIVEGKKMLESVIRTNINPNYEVRRFCYPRGRFSDRVKEVVKRAGFLEARTVKAGCIDFPKDPFEARPTVHIMPFRKYDIVNSCEITEYEKVPNLLVWTEYAKAKFDEVIEEGGRFEAWSHSWELEKYHQWEFLEDFLAYMDEQMTKIGYPRRMDIPYYEIK